MNKTLTVIFAIIAVALSGIRGFQALQKPDPPALEPVAIGMTAPDLSAPIIIATNNGFFTDDCLNVTITYYDSGRNAVDDRSLVAPMEDEARWMIACNMANENSVPDFRKYINIYSLEEIKPGSVRIIG